MRCSFNGPYSTPEVSKMQHALGEPINRNGLEGRRTVSTHDLDITKAINFH
jgi:hypothetical protein